MRFRVNVLTVLYGHLAQSNSLLYGVIHAAWHCRLLSSPRFWECPANSTLMVTDNHECCAHFQASPRIVELHLIMNFLQIEKSRKGHSRQKEQI